MSCNAGSTVRESARARATEAASARWLESFGTALNWKITILARADGRAVCAGPEDHAPKSTGAAASVATPLLMLVNVSHRPGWPGPKAVCA